MKIVTLPVKDAYLIEPVTYSDERGLFFETYNKIFFESLDIKPEFIQDNQSISHKNILRGLHFQNPPFEQGKFVRVARGAVLDVIVDIRKSSPSFGQHYMVRLDDSNNLMLWIPPGFAHGFLSLENHTVFLYKVTNIYNKSSESGIRWNDPDLNINWQIENPLVSSRDANLSYFRNFMSEF